jgi:hypothetical protein
MSQRTERILQDKLEAESKLSEGTDDLMSPKVLPMRASA